MFKVWKQMKLSQRRLISNRRSDVFSLKQMLEPKLKTKDSHLWVWCADLKTLSYRVHLQTLPSLMAIPLLFLTSAWTTWSLTLATKERCEENKLFFLDRIEQFSIQAFKVNHWQISTGKKFCKVLFEAEPITIQQWWYFGLFFISKCLCIYYLPF